jgi:nicotinate-nucleotide adenylyltransferase
MPEPLITPAPIPSDINTILLFGGTFDPPHVAHAALPARVRDEVLGPDAWLLYVPAAQSPLKGATPRAPDRDRLEMLDILLEAQSIDRASIWTDELDRAAARPGPNYTIDTVERLGTLVPAADIRLLIGSDQAADFHRWRCARNLFDDTRPLVMLREPYGSKDALKNALAANWSAHDIELWLSRIAATDLIEISSSSLRAMLRASPRDKSALQKALSPEVFDYIETHALY